MSSTDQGGGSGAQTYLDQEARSTLTGIKVYMDVQDQALRPSGECAKVCDGFCRYGDVAFNLDSHVVAVAEKKFFHILDCVGWVSHGSSRSRSNTRML